MARQRLHLSFISQFLRLLPRPSSTPPTSSLCPSRAAHKMATSPPTPFLLSQLSLTPFLPFPLRSWALESHWLWNYLNYSYWQFTCYLTPWNITSFPLFFVYSPLLGEMQRNTKENHCVVWQFQKEMRPSYKGQGFKDFRDLECLKLLWVTTCSYTQFE